jgi:hypothetical protein
MDLRILRNVLWMVGMMVWGVGSVEGQTSFTATYNLSGGGNDVTSFNYNGSPITGAIPGPLLKFGITSSSSSGNYRGSNWALGATDGSDVFTGSVDLDKYIGVTIDAVPGYEISITSITFGVGRSGTGPRQWQWRGSADSYGNSIDNYTTLNSGLTNSNGILTNPDTSPGAGWTGNVLNVAASYADLTTATFRLYGFNAEATGGTGGLQGNITITGTYTFSCTPPTTQAANFNATNLQPTQMDLSWMRGDGDNVLVLARQGSPVNADPVDGTGYTANAAFGSGQQIGSGNFVVYNGSSTGVTVTGLSANTTYHYAAYEYHSADNCYLKPGLTGDAATPPPPSLTVNPATLNGFTYVEGAGPSGSQSYSLTGSNLLPASGSIAIVAPSNYEISSNNTAFTNAFDASYSGGTINAIIYVRLKAGLAAGTYNDEIITNSGGGASTQHVTCNGTVTLQLFFRSRQTGNWGAASTWESSPDGAAWTNATRTPLASDFAITIRNHTVTINSAITLDETTVEAGGTLIYGSGGNLIIEDGPGDDLVVFGTFRHTVNSGFPLAGGASIRIKGNAVLEVTVAASGISDYGSSAQLFYEHNATFFWNTGNATAFASANTTYFVNTTSPNEIPIFRVNATNPSVGAGSTTAINGLLQVDNAITWQNAGVKIFRNGITGAGTVTQAASSGAFQITSTASSIASNTTTLSTGGLIVTSSSVAELGGNKTINGGMVTVEGVLDCGAQAITGTASFSLNSGATLITANASGVSGSIATTGAKTYAAGANYEFQGASTGIFSSIANNVTINSPSGVALTNPLTVNGTLALSSGNLALGANTLTIAAAGAISGGSAASYVVTNGIGRLKRNGLGATPAFFPIGDAVYFTPMNLANTGTVDNFAAKFTQVYPVCFITSAQQEASVVGTWEISEDVPGGSNCTISIDKGAVPTGSSFSIFNAVIAHCAGTDIGQLDGIGSGTTVTGSGFTTFSPFGIGNAAVLPIELLSFDARQQGQAALLTWRTASEKDNDYMAVERSADGRAWAEIGRVAGAGTTAIPQDYRFTDEKPLLGLNYYRLRQVDFDGSYEYHRTVALDFRLEGRPGWQVYPSLARSWLRVRLDAPGPQEAQVLIVNMQGQALWQGQLPAGTEELEIDLARLPAGLYALLLWQGGQQRAKRFVKE